MKASEEVATWLIDKGEEMDQDEWELIDERKVDYETENMQDALWTFARAIPGSSAERSSRGVSEQDNELIRVRYAYAPKVTGKNGNSSRDFCTKMVGAGNRVWRKEDIIASGNRAVNPGWGQMVETGTLRGCIKAVDRANITGSVAPTYARTTSVSRSTSEGPHS